MKTGTMVTGLLLGALIVVLLLGGCQAKEAPSIPTATPTPVAKAVTLRYSDPYVYPTQETMAVHWFMDEITKRTSGRVKFEIYHAGTITKAGEELDAIKDRVVDCGLVGTWYYTGRLYLWQTIRQIPFGISDNTLISKIAAQMMNQMPELRNEIEQYNQKIFWAHPSSDYHIYSKTPIKTLEDFKGKKMAAVGLVGRWISVLGATPVASPVTERYNNLQTGAEDGGILSVGMVPSYKLDDFAKYITIAGLGSSMAVVFSVNNNAWKELPKADQDIFLELSPQIPEKAGALNDGLDKKAIDSIKAKGGDLFILSDADRTKWAKMLPNLPKEYAAELEKKGIPGNKLYDLYFKLAKEAGWKFFRDYWAE